MGHARTSSLPCRPQGSEPLSTDDHAAARPFFFGTNLKMYQTPAETCALLDGLAPLFPRPGVQTFVLPSFTSLPDARVIRTPRKASIRASYAGNEESSIALARSAAGAITITYTGTLQAATTVTGPYAPVTGATSPYTVSATGPMRFFRTVSP